MAIVDTLEAVRKLRDAGMDETQAEAVVGIIGSVTDDLMTKSDAAQLKSELNQFEAVIKSELNQFKIEYKADIHQLQSELNQFKAVIQSELAESKSELNQFKAVIQSELAQSKSELNQFKAVIQSELAQTRAESKSDLSLFKGNFYRALWIQGLSLVVIVGAFVTAATALN